MGGVARVLKICPLIQIAPQLAASVSIVRASVVGRAVKSSFCGKPPLNNHYLTIPHINKMPSLAKTVKIPSSPTILEVTEDSSNDKSYEHESNKKLTEYSSLLPSRADAKKTSIRRPKYETCIVESSDSSDGDAGDELSSNSSSSFTSGMSSRQLLVFIMVMISTCSSSFTVCLFPPFFPALVEKKGVYATGYGLIIGTNCLVAFLVTPLIGNNLGRIIWRWCLLRTIWNARVYTSGAIFPRHCCVHKSFPCHFKCICYHRLIHLHS